MAEIKDQSHYTGEFDSAPKSPDNPNESSLWKSLLSLIKPSLSTAVKKVKKFAQNIYDAENDKKKAETKILLANAAKIGNEANLIANEKVKEVNKQITDITTNDKVPENIKQLQLAYVIANNPEVIEQIEKLKDIQKVLNAVHFTRIEHEIVEIEAEENKTTNINSVVIFPQAFKKYLVGKYALTKTQYDYVTYIFQEETPEYIMKKFKIDNNSFQKLERRVVDKFMLTFAMELRPAIEEELIIFLKNENR